MSSLSLLLIVSLCWVSSLEFSPKGKILKKEEISKDRKSSTVLLYDSQNRQEKVWFRNFDKNKLVIESIMTFRYRNDSVFVNTDIIDNGKNLTNLLRRF